MNPDRIALKHILEGLVHNLNNPLNLILGYAQRLRQIDPECSEAERIYKAGIAIDDTLKELTMKLWSNSFDLSIELDLALWLSGELKYLKHYLPVKHHILFVREDEADMPAVLASPLSLSIWYESVLGALMAIKQTLQLKTGICYYQEHAAIYLELPDDIAELPELMQIAHLSYSPQLSQSAKVKTEWEPASRRIYGVLT